MTDSVIESTTGTEQKLPSPDVTLPQLETEIKYHLNQISQNVIEIGKRLIQAKSLVQHGQWLNWLEQNFQLKERMARNFMQCAERFGNRQTNIDLNQSQMMALLALFNTEETEKFIEQKAAEGTPVENMSVKNIRKEIKQWNSSKEEHDTNQLSETQPIETIDISDHSASQNQDSADQSDSNETDDIPYDNSEIQQLADETSHDYEAPNELPDTHLMDTLSGTSSSLINQENYRAILQHFAKTSPDQLEVVIQNLTAIVNDLQNLLQKD